MSWPAAHRRLFRYGTRSLLVVLTLICISLALILVPAQRQRRIVEAIRRNPPSRALYDYEFAGATPARGPQWLREWLGDDCFQYISRVELLLDGQDDPTPSELAMLAGLEQLSLEGAPLSNEGLSELARLPKLENVWIKSADLNTRGIAGLTHLKTLTRLSIIDSRLTDEELLGLASLPKLRYLNIETRANPQYTPAGVAHLQSKTPNLEVYYTRCESGCGNGNGQELKNVNSPARRAP